ncbi:MAG: glutamate synthase-related protein, partial [Terriglobia bacterium]
IRKLMNLFRCNVCNVFTYNKDEGHSNSGILPGTDPAKFPESWHCPVCSADKTHLKPYSKANLEYDPERKRTGDRTELRMDDIHNMAVTGRSIVEPMRTTAKVISWDDILIRAAQLARIPLNKEVPVVTETVIGPAAKHPVVISSPVYVTHMSFGELSKELKISIAKATSAVKTAMGSGEGGVLEETVTTAHKYIFEYVPNKYGVNDKNLGRVDAVEIKIGQSAKPGMGGSLPGRKVTAEVAKMRGYPEGKDIESPASYEDIRSPDDLKAKVSWLRDKTGGKPIGVKFAAGHIEADLEVAIQAEPDFITLDGRPGATAGAIKLIKKATSMPTVFALSRARKYLDKRGVKDITLVITGGLRTSPDFAKALALGADAVAIGTAALMAAACQQYRICDTGNCPVGVTTQEPALRERMDIEAAAKRLENFLTVSTEELRAFARLTGRDNIHDLSADDLLTTDSEISRHTPIEHA